MIGYGAHGRRGWEEAAEVLVDYAPQLLLEMRPLGLGHAHCHRQTLSERRGRGREGRI